jgi:YggT family protein
VWFSSILTVIYVLLIAYLLLISIRVVLGWFAPRALGRAWDLLAGVTDPYLTLFGRIRFLRGNLFDFSPIAAILVLVVALDLVNQLLYYGRITLGFFFASVFSAAWSGARFLLLLFLVVGILRTIPIIFRASAGASIWRVVDTIMQPIVAWVMRLFRLGRRSGYTQHLLLTVGLLFVAWLLGELIVREIVTLFQMLPF